MRGRLRDQVPGTQPEFDTLDGVMPHRPRRRLSRRVSVLALLTGSALLASPAAAQAAPPEGWTPTEPSALQFLLVLLIFPLGLFLVIAVLSMLSSAGTSGRYTPGLAWRNEDEWFGGPRAGVDAADRVDPAAIEGAEGSDRGGASARW